MIWSRRFAVLHSESLTRAITLSFGSDAALGRGGLSPPSGCLLLNILSRASVVDDLITLPTVAQLIFSSQNRFFFQAQCKDVFSQTSWALFRAFRARVLSRDQLSRVASGLLPEDLVHFIFSDEFALNR